MGILIGLFVFALILCACIYLIERALRTYMQGKSMQETGSNTHGMQRNMANGIRVKIQGVADLSAIDGKSVIIMTDEAETRQMGIICNPKVRHEMGLRHGLYVGSDEQRANVADALQTHLPEVMGHILQRMGIEDMAITIRAIHKGEYEAVMHSKEREDIWSPVDVTDGIIYAYANPGTAELFVDRRVWMEQSTPYTGSPNGIALPLNILPDDMLKRVMNDAIDKENYEMAQRVQKELNSRNK